MKTSKNQLNAILFSDIVGYTALMESDVNRAMAQLERYTAISQSVVDKFGGRIVKTYGDGSLIIFTSAVQAVGCAEELQLGCQQDPSIPLRIGLHVGEVIEKDNDVFGNAINIASRIESMSVAGGILFSKNIHDQISNEPRFSSVEIGSFEFKNIQKPIEVFGLTNHNFPVPDRKTVVGKFKSPEKKSNKTLLVLGSVLLLSLFGFGAYKFVGPNDKVHVIELQKEEGGRQNSIAILPFDNMSTNEENQYFTDGMHDDLLTFLSKTKHLKVISRTSVSKLKDTEQDIKEIAEMLDVSHVMEGSVRRVGDQVRINVQLVDAASDNNLWAEIYDIQVTPKNIFEIQSEIATKISNTLIQSVFAQDAIIEPSQYTENLTAYENFLRAKQLKESGNKEALYEAKELLEEAISLDENFAEAIILLGNLHIHLVYYGGEDPDVYFPRAWDYMEEGMAIKPDYSDAHSLKGSLNHWWKRNFEGAKEGYDEAIKLQPNNYSALYGLAIAYQDLNLDVKEINHLIQQAIAINPLNPDLINLAGIYQRENNQINNALNTFRKGIDLEPNHANLWLNYAGTFYFKSRIDSVAIISYKSIEVNGKDGKNLDSYLGSLASLSALEELDDELSKMDASSRQQVITKLMYQRDYYIQSNQFDKAESIIDELVKLKVRRQDTNTKYSSFVGDLFLFENYYLQRQYGKAIDQYEKIFSDIDPQTIVNDYSQNDLNATVNYLYALQQTGGSEKIEPFLELIRKERLETNDNNLRLHDLLYKKYLQAAFSIFEGDVSQAVKYLDQYLSEGNLSSIRWIAKEPLFDSLKGQPAFDSMILKYKEEHAKQREAFRMFLKSEQAI